MNNADPQNRSEWRGRLRIFDKSNPQMRTMDHKTDDDDDVDDDGDDDDDERFKTRLTGVWHFNDLILTE